MRFCDAVRQERMLSMRAARGTTQLEARRRNALPPLSLKIIVSCFGSDLEFVTRWVLLASK
jgi:hypothetical protein